MYPFDGPSSDSLVGVGMLIGGSKTWPDIMAEKSDGSLLRTQSGLELRH